MYKRQLLLDLDYAEDSTAQVDMNVVMRRSLDGKTSDFIEVQGTGEQGTFSRAQMNEMLDSASAGIRELFTAQRTALAS